MSIKWAIVDNNKIVNVIIAESKEIAEEVSGLQAIEDNGRLGIGLELTSDGWRFPYPTDGKEYVWNDTLQYWSEVLHE